MKNETKSYARPIKVKHNIMILLIHKNGNELFEVMMLLLCKMGTLMCEKWNENTFATD